MLVLFIPEFFNILRIFCKLYKNLSTYIYIVIVPTYNCSDLSVLTKIYGFKTYLIYHKCYNFPCFFMNRIRNYQILMKKFYVLHSFTCAYVHVFWQWKLHIRLVVKVEIRKFQEKILRILHLIKILHLISSITSVYITRVIFSFCVTRELTFIDIGSLKKLPRGIN